ncbi:hypothetical protein JVT61DRAFT_14228 [Boletus reticuloceps]|uniref:Uncharacterized protein n=1 Tax=Boletus reticuloceps TaxID=495285 RepID=A0A8I2YCY2_9AGAM|nr:hypothetical protein JVT61DRAFT_1441 [Boletus reticuloceps]KAG6369607.1 hypothetical protein JVT61DRAFT_14228 [Boletus reticuloceps]
MFSMIADIQNTEEESEFDQEGEGERMEKITDKPTPFVCRFRSQRCIMLALLVDMDECRHLDESARALVAADISSFAHVSLYDELRGTDINFLQALSPEMAMGDTVPLVLPGVLLLAEDSKPGAPSILASSLWHSPCAR